MQTHNYRLGYRSDIEGLRAIAILLVVAAHARITWLAGGFVGVDVFFVLSGYLITGLLVQEVLAHGELRFAAFYARRFRRLLPALLVMLVCTCVLGYLLIAPGEQSGQAMGAASAAMWLSNFHFAFSNMGYFSPDAETNLFLHTWSLGVEEQFYLVWPLILVLSLGAWSAAQRRRDTTRLKVVMSFVLAVSFVVSVWWTRTEPHLAFYMMPARAWQFALGALVFLHFGAPATSASAQPTSSVKTMHAAGWIGLTLIVFSALVLDTKIAYPGAWALLPSIGAAIVLAVGARSPAAGVGGVLSMRPMQAIGRISYTWYLWHWPVLLLGATVMDIDGIATRCALVLLSFVLAALSYRFVETPIRNTSNLLARPGLAVLAALVLVILSSALAIHWNNAAQKRMTLPEQTRYLTVRSEAPIIYAMGCDDWYRSADVHACSFGAANAQHTAVAIGDSVALQWFAAYAEQFNTTGWRLLVYTKSSCPMVDEPIFYPRIGRDYSECTQWRRDALREIAGLNPDVVIMGSTFTYNFSQEQWVTGTARVLKAISPTTRQIFIMRSTPVLPFDGPSCLAPRSSLYKAISRRSECVAPASDALSDNVYAWLNTAAAQFSNVNVIDMTDVICPNKQCHAELDGTIVFRDSQHLALAFTEALAPVFAKRIKAQER